MGGHIDELTRLGDGPVATVYSGLRQGVPVALKVFSRRFDRRTMALFAQEQSALAGLRRSAPILPVDGFDELATGELAVRMELCPQSLARLVERGGPLNPADVLVIGRTVALALAAAHRSGIAHGGVSPHNVLFRASGEMVVSDFGTALRRALVRDRVPAADYLPPERHGELDERTDLYGLGAVLYFALTGRPPYPARLGEQPGERARRIRHDPLPAVDVEDVPIGLATLLARLLATRPADRPSDAVRIADQLGELMPEPPREPDADEFDDFAAPVPPPGRPTSVTYPTAPAPAPPTSACDLDEFDDFAVPGPLPPVGRGYRS